MFKTLWKTIILSFAQCRSQHRPMTHNSWAACMVAIKSFMFFTRRSNLQAAVTTERTERVDSYRQWKVERSVLMNLISRDRLLSWSQWSWTLVKDASLSWLSSDAKSMHKIKMEWLLYTNQFGVIPKITSNYWLIRELILTYKITKASRVEIFWKMMIIKRLKRHYKMSLDQN